MKKNLLLNIIMLLCCYLLVLFHWGYQFGRSDQAEVLPYALYLHDHSLYPKDNFIQDVKNEVPNERYVFSLILSLFADHMEAACFILELIFTLILLWGMFHFARLFIKNDLLCWLAVMVLMLVKFDITLGGNTIWYSYFIPSMPAKAIAIWGLIFFFRDKWTSAFVLFSASAFLQPLVGLQLAIICITVLFIELFVDKKPLRINHIFPRLFFELTAGVYIFLIFWNSFNSSVTKAEHKQFFNIEFAYRGAHHYMPSSFPWQNYIWLVPLFLFAFFYYRKISRTMWLFFLFDFLLLLLYTIGVQWLHFGYVAALQWFKTTVWLKYFSVIAIMILLDKNIPFLKKTSIKNIYYSVIYIVAVLALVLIIWFPEKNPWGFNFDFGQQKTTDPLIACSIKAKELTPQNALFIQPLNSSEFKYYSQRSSYVDFKANVRAPRQVINWFARLQELYGLKAIPNYPDKQILTDSKSYYLSLTGEQLHKLADEGVQYMLTYSEYKTNLPVIYQNDEYKILDIRH
jgi:hypothetical protein